MDFGDILEQWEKESREVRRSHAGEHSGSLSGENGGSPSEQGRRCAAGEKRVHPVDWWLRRYGTEDKDAEEDARRERERLASREYLKNMPPEARLDLHGLTREEAWVRLDHFIGECCRRGLKKVLIVHGKGNHSGDTPVLNSVVRLFIEQDRRLGASGHPGADSGGKGATWVVIKNGTKTV